MLDSCGLKNDVQAAASGCDEFQTGGQAVATLEIDGKVKAFAQASADAQGRGQRHQREVKLACINIAKDLGETDRGPATIADSSLTNCRQDRGLRRGGEPRSTPS